MKANAPEKIWIEPASDLPKLSGHIDKDSVEYVRKDAFVEKACEWIEKRAARYLVDRFVDGMRITGIDTSITDDFKNYMKGE